MKKIDVTALGELLIDFTENGSSISGTLISFDPNLREPLWESLDDAKKEIEYGLSKCNILKISDNEIEFHLGHSDYDKAALQLMEKHENIKLIFITLGGDGSCAYTRNAKANDEYKIDKIKDKIGRFIVEYNSNLCDVKG